MRECVCACVRVRVVAVDVFVCVLAWCVEGVDCLPLPIELVCLFVVCLCVCVCFVLCSCRGMYRLWVWCTPATSLEEAYLHQCHGVLIRCAQPGAVCTSPSTPCDHQGCQDHAAAPSCGDTAQPLCAQESVQDHHVRSHATLVHRPFALVPCSPVGCLFFSDYRIVGGSPMVLDEVDALASKHSEVLYHLFNWAHAPRSRLLLISISNTFDLISRTLPSLRVKPTQLAFETYTVEQIVEIVDARLHTAFQWAPPHDNRVARVLDKAAVEFVARKVAKSSGDLRKTLDLVGRAVADSAARCSCGLRDPVDNVLAQLGLPDWVSSGQGTTTAGAGAGAGAGVNAGTAGAASSVSTSKAPSSSAPQVWVDVRDTTPPSAPHRGGGAEQTAAEECSADSGALPCDGHWTGVAVDFSTMARVVRAGMSSHVVDAITHLPRHCQILLFVALQQAKDARRLPLPTLQHAYSRFCHQRKLPAAPSSHFSDQVAHLSSAGLVHTVRDCARRMNVDPCVRAVFVFPSL